MDNPLYTIHRRALLAESMLRADDRKALEATVASLAGLPEKDWPSKGGMRLSLPEPTFLFDLGPSLRVFLKPEPDGRPEVLDFADQETLDLFGSLDSAEEPTMPVQASSP